MTGTRLTLALWFIGLTLVLGAQAARAAPGTESPEYRDAVDGAVREFSERNFEESRALFARAHALYPNARTLRGLGMAEFELRNYAECIKQLEAALSARERPLDERLRGDTRRLLETALSFHSLLRGLPGEAGLVAMDACCLPSNTTSTRCRKRFEPRLPSVASRPKSAWTSVSAE